MNNKISVGIIGGGISGLVFANFLRDDNKFNIRIFEKSNYSSVHPSGIQISNNARRVLNKINFNQINQDAFSEIENVNISDYRNKKIIGKLSLKNFNKDRDDYVCLDRNVLINFLINRINKKVELVNKEVVSVKDNSIFFPDGNSEKFDFIVVADGISDYRNKKIIGKLSLKNFNKDRDDYVCLDRNVLINFLINRINKKVELVNKEVVSVKDNSIFFPDGNSEKFDFIVVADGMFSKIRNSICNSESLQKSKVIAYKGVVQHIDDIGNSNVELFLGDKKHFVFYPINKRGDYSFTAIFNSDSSCLVEGHDQPVYVDNLLDISDDAHTDIKKIISSAKNIYKWPIYSHTKITFGNNNVFIIGDASHAMMPFHAQGAAQSVEDAYCLAKMFENKIFSIDDFSSQRLGRVSSIVSKSSKNLSTYHLSNFWMRLIRNFFIRIVCKYKFLANLVFGKIYNYKFKN